MPILSVTRWAQGFEAAMRFVQCRIDEHGAGVKMSAKPDPLRTTAMLPASKTIFLGCIAGAIAVLTFHQTTLQLYFWLGLAPQAAFRVAVVPPFNAPMVVSITFWGAVYGGLFGLLTPRLPKPVLVKALIAGSFALLMGWFVVGPLAGRPIAFGWQAAPMLRSAVASLMWGIGVTLILPLLYPRGLTGARRPWRRHHLAT
jgi:hypothetical protein